MARNVVVYKAVALPAHVCRTPGYFSNAAGCTPSVDSCGYGTFAMPHFAGNVAANIPRPAREARPLHHLSAYEKSTVRYEYRYEYGTRTVLYSTVLVRVYSHQTVLVLVPLRPTLLPAGPTVQYEAGSDKLKKTGGRSTQVLQ